MLHGDGQAEIITEWRAKRAVARLRQCVPKDASVLRGARLLTVPMAEVVPGDVVILKAGMASWARTPLGRRGEGGRRRWLTLDRWI